MRGKTATARCLGAREWMAQTPVREGLVVAVLAGLAGAPQQHQAVAPPPMGGKDRTDLGDAPGLYVRQR